MRTDNPLVSVVMPVYMADDFLLGSIDSILNQTYENLELLIICTDPTSKTIEILDVYARSDERIKIDYNQEEGLIESLNRGCRSARGRYIVRMDADDISCTDRIEKQVTFMEEHPDIGFSGSLMEVIDRSGKFVRMRNYPVSPLVIKWTLMYANCLAHPTIIMRRDIAKLLGFYRKEALYVEDYDLWVRASAVSHLSNIPEVLVKYRFHENNCSRVHELEKRDNEVIVSCSAIQKAWCDTIDEDLFCAFKKWKIDRSLSLGQIDILEHFIEDSALKLVRDNCLSDFERSELGLSKAKIIMELARCSYGVSLRKASSLVFYAIKTHPEILPQLLQFIRLYNRWYRT